MEQQQPDTIRGSMYERVFRFSAEHAVFAGVFAAALALCAGTELAAAQGLGRPSVIVDESVLDQLGPPPQTLPDVILQQQPQSNRPAQRVGSDAAAVSATPGKLLPPPRSMPKSRVMLPSSLQSVAPEEAAAARAPAAHTPKLTPPKVDQAERPSAPPAPPVAVASPEPTAVPPKIIPPTASVPDAPSVTPPPAPERNAPATASAETAAPTTPEPAVTKAAVPEAPPAPPSVPKLVPPAPLEAAKAAEPKPAPPATTEAASIPKPPAVEPPPQPAATETPPASLPSIAGKAPSPRASKPMPELAAQPAPQESRGESASESPAAPSQIAALPPAAAPEILDDGQLYRIPFGTVSSEITEEGKKHLDELAQRLKKDDSLRLQLLGYASGTEDSASKARRTSLFRALSVRTYLMKQGVRSTRMDVRALGTLAEGGAPDRVDAVLRK
jgi:outer membrane protein OmpA-like peptidoglycan-associated protein